MNGTRRIIFHHNVYVGTRVNLIRSFKAHTVSGIVTHYRGEELIGVMIGIDYRGVMVMTLRNSSFVFLVHDLPFSPGLVGQRCLMFDSQQSKVILAGLNWHYQINTLACQLKI
jgi:hypothetical protein